MVVLSLVLDIKPTARSWAGRKEGWRGARGGEGRGGWGGGVLQCISQLSALSLYQDLPPPRQCACVHFFCLYRSVQDAPPRTYTAFLFFAAYTRHLNR